MTPTDMVLVAALLATPFVAWRLCRWLEGLADRNGAVLADRTVQVARTKGPAIGWADLIDPGDDLTAVADAVREEVCTCCDIHSRNCEPPSELCCWRCTESQHDTFPIPHADGSECVLRAKDVAEGLYDHLAPTLREERINPLYASRVLTLYGPGFVHRGCLAARRDHATDHICGLCGKSFGQVAA